MKIMSLITGVLALGCLGATAMADSDVAPGVFNNKIVTGGWDDDASAYAAPPISSYDFDFGGDDPFQPFFTEDPGFHAKDRFFPSAAISFIPNSTLRFNVLSDLLYWDGSGLENFGPAPAGTLLTLEKGSFSMTVGTGESLPKLGLLLGTSDVLGELHEHLASTLSNSFGDPLPGVYRFDMSLFTDMPGIAASDPVSIHYSLVPEPVSLLLLGAGLTGAALQRRARHTSKCC